MHLTHCPQGHVERMIGVDVREIARVQSAFRERLKELRDWSMTRTVLRGAFEIR